MIQVIYDDGSNGLIRVAREAKRQKKSLKDMTSEEITKTCFGLFR